MYLCDDLSIRIGQFFLIAHGLIDLAQNLCCHEQSWFFFLGHKEAALPCVCLLSSFANFQLDLSVFIRIRGAGISCLMR